MKPKQTYRLNAAIALLGVTSRRKADSLIKAGRVSINGKTVVEMGTQVNPYKEEIEIDGVPIDRPSKRRVYYAMYKPSGVVTTLSDPEGRKTIVQFIPQGPRVFPIGRLDYDAEGLILLTNDGDVANRLMHPKFGAKRTYLVKVKGKPTPEVVSKLRKGVKLEDGFAKPLDVKFDRTTKENSWFRMVVAEGRNRLIKRLWLRMKHPVAKLIRIEYAGIKLGRMSAGDVRTLTSQELDSLKRA